MTSSKYALMLQASIGPLDTLNCTFVSTNHLLLLKV